MNTERNRENLTGFLDLFLNKRAIRAAFEKYALPNYIQHSSGIENGRENAIIALEAMFRRLDDVEITVRHVIVDGDHAAVHIHGHSRCDGLRYNVVDVFRFEDGMLAEHWDVFAPTKDQQSPVI